MFFVDKDDLENFQNRCIVAIFLDFHHDVEFSEFVNKNHFRGLWGNQNREIWLFKSPSTRNGNEIIFLATKNNSKDSLVFANGFLEEYRLFADNPYEYLKKKFKSLNWEEKYKKLFISNPPKEKELYKYKGDPNKADDEAVRIFNEFVDGDLTFVNPITCNDPFDCDCELDMGDALPLLLYKAIIKTKYGEHPATIISKPLLTEVIYDFSKKELKLENISAEKLRAILNEAYHRYNLNSTSKNKGGKKVTLKEDSLKEIINNFYSMISQTKNIKNEFRILCTAKNPKDILMWGYYGNSGKGLCVKHYGHNIEDAIKSENVGIICVYGNVNYQVGNTKPQFKAENRDMLDNIFKYIIECTFTKFQKWNHEEEFRYVLIGDDLENDYIPVHSKAAEYYLGCKYDEVNFYKSKKWPKPPIILKKHKTEYRLV